MKCENNITYYMESEKLLNDKIKSVNYVSHELLKNITTIWNRLTPLEQQYLNEKVKLISDMLTSRFDKLKFITDYNILENTRHYVLKVERNFILPDNPNFSSSTEIKKIINTKMDCKLHFKSGEIKKDINLVFYYNNKDNREILYKNINKIITRLWNLLLIFGERKTNKNLNDTVNQLASYPYDFTTPKDFEYHFFLYNNVRKANKNKSGSDYLNRLHNTPMKCANTSSGLTIFFINIGDSQPKVIVSRLEESLGLLTHEFMHSSYLFPGYFSGTFNININLNTNEMFINSLATIFHSYLISKELGLNLKKVILNELIHSINHSIRLEKITGITMENIFRIEIMPWKPIYNHICPICTYKNPLTKQICEACGEYLPITNPKQFIFEWKQNAYLYEYIIGRMLILINIDILLNDTNNEILQIILSRKNTFQINQQNIELINNFIKQIHQRNDTFLSLYNHIKSLNYLDTCKNCVKEDDTTCGHMIMQYFLFDPIEVPDEKKEINLYGGYYEKYLKYKSKYLQLSKLIKNKK